MGANINTEDVWTNKRLTSSKGRRTQSPKFLHIKKINKYDLTLCKSRLHTASETFIHHKKFGSGSIFCLFASVAGILIGKDDEYEKTCENAGLSVQTFSR